MSLNPSIVLVNLDNMFNERISPELQEAGYTPIIVDDSHQVLENVKIHQPAMVVINRQHNDNTGFSLCSQLRKQQKSIILIMMINAETVEERVACLEAGADDYLVKTDYSPALLKLVCFYLTPTQTAKEQLQYSDIILDLTTRKLFVNNNSIELTMKEFELLKYLMSHPQEVLSRDKILENVWGDEFQGESNVIEVYIRYLRIKIENEDHKRLIHTVRGVGYVLREG
ncbi:MULTISPECIES: response regulator transcription factor NblR [Crocosphaera]|uniref:Response regulator receiver:Transcriptional regulatory protein, C-terminal n=5 Tax=Crocosphaera watsonii TaxID=263511 RepID=T2JMH0_CROWT|nr:MULTISPECIES: response regulator transcription factor [Crocosphaera]EHJ15333.1 Response regulator receiver:Transcriptional regulatory protein [Crocosphaera watsonii WH 0003]MCH2243504.1 response regulator transcription factor [Crocosphaera sp.]NQZ61888.1 response regulator transcription factor [Crocosphaera sp.]CCQ53047.1 Response regulator receiver:Transcriptional regulatory protein, C-terminal [Crocosphaera watsonii WH 8502]CCQ58277.1 Response regulator receiver:Transcriptional regulatory